jgi:hypothetical protein
MEKTMEKVCEMKEHIEDGTAVNIERDVANWKKRVENDKTRYGRRSRF